MILWISVALIVAVAMFVLLRALATPPTAIEPAQEEAAHYRGQQAEIERQLGAGMISAAEARSAEAEAARKLLARSRENIAAPVANEKRGRLAQIMIALAIPALGLPIYLYLGSPELPAQPIATRTDINRNDQELNRLLARLDAHLADAPDDVKGFELAFPVYMRLGKYDSAVSAAERLLVLKGPNAAGFAMLAEAQIFAAQGAVSDDARKSLASALELDPKLSRAVFYNGLAVEQAGDPQKALEIWHGLSASLPEGAEKRAVDAQINRVEKRAPPQTGPAGESADAIRAMPEGERNQAIRGMVDGLESRLKSSGGTADEWQRLVRALAVLGEKERAVAALKAAKAQHAADSPVIAALGQLATDLSLETGSKP